MWLKIQFNYRNMNFKFFQRDFGEQNVKKISTKSPICIRISRFCFLKKMSVGQKISEF